MKDLHEKLKDLAARLNASGQKDDAAIVFAAVFATAPGPEPTIETLSQPMAGMYYHLRYYG